MADENKKKNVHTGHRGRMRERFRISGFDNYQPHEVLEMLLFDFIPVVNTNPIAHALIESFGSVWKVLTAPKEELVKVPGIGPKTAERICQVYLLYSSQICAYFRNAGALTRYDIAFLADWFMEGISCGSIGLLVCDYERRFQDFISLHIREGQQVFELAEQIVQAARGRAYFLLIKEEHSLLPRETLQMLRQITGCGQAYLIDAFVLEGDTPVSVLYR